MSRPEISIPSTTTSPTPSPHTVYELTLRLPLRTFVLQKRYSDFTALHSLITQQASNTAPPASLPPKSIFSSTLKNPALVEQRRQGLEAYLRAINDSPDPRWRETPAWRAFLNLPASSSKTSLNKNSDAAQSAQSALTAHTQPITDPVAWLDAHREVKGYLHAARVAIAARDDASVHPSAASTTTTSLASTTSTAPTTTINTTSTRPGSAAASALTSSGPQPSPNSTHEAAATAKKNIVKATTLLGPLEKGLASQSAEWTRNRLGEGEVRRRKDLLSAARTELQSLETLQSLVRRKGEADAAVNDLAGGAASEKGTLFAGAGSFGSDKKGVIKGRRVLGKETDKTRELDNKGVLQLQQQIVKDQDEGLEVLTKAVRRQREIGVQIQEELAVQDDMLRLLDEDVDRVQGKVDVARKRTDKIS